MEMNTLKDMVLGKPAPLVSTFRLSYYSILNLMSRAEGQFTAEHVIRHSFHQFQYEKVSSSPSLRSKQTFICNVTKFLLIMPFVRPYLILGIRFRSSRKKRQCLMPRER